MHVRELAQIAEIAPRMVRCYHHLGLLKIPPAVCGQREYGVEYVARLLRARWLVGGGLSLTQMAEMSVLDTTGADQDFHREAVLRDLRATRGTVETYQRSLTEQASRVDELTARVGRGEGLSPAPSALTRFYDDIKARIIRLGDNVHGLWAERQTMMVLASLGMVPDSAIPFVEALGEADHELSTQQVAGSARLATPNEAEGCTGAHRLVRNSQRLACRHREHALIVLNDFPPGAPGHAM